jgi:hypothetical protein
MHRHALWVVWVLLGLAGPAHARGDHPGARRSVGVVVKQTLDKVLSVVRPQRTPTVLRRAEASLHAVEASSITSTLQQLQRRLPGLKWTIRDSYYDGYYIVAKLRNGAMVKVTREDNGGQSLRFYLADSTLSPKLQRTLVDVISRRAPASLTIEPPRFPVLNTPSR